MKFVNNNNYVRKNTRMTKVTRKPRSIKKIYRADATNTFILLALSKPMI